jgi:hypothetical protein
MRDFRQKMHDARIAAEKYEMKVTLRELGELDSEIESDVQCD